MLCSVCKKNTAVIFINKQGQDGKTELEGLCYDCAKKRGIKRMSAQAVGTSVGWNPICVIIPCHRVVGTNGSLTGYGGGIKNKIELLKLEGNDMSKYFVPKRGTAL